MDIRFHSLCKGSVRLDAVLVPFFEGVGIAEEGCPEHLRWVRDSQAYTDHSGAVGEIAVCYGTPGSLFPRVLLVGVGDRAGLSRGRYRTAVASGIRRCRALKLARVGLMLDTAFDELFTSGKAQVRQLAELVYAALVASYSCTEYRSEEAKLKGKKDKSPDFFTLDSLVILHGGSGIPAALRLPVKMAEAEAAGVCLARDLVNAPPNILTPAKMAEEALLLAKRHGFGCRVLQKLDMQKLGMGSLLAVAEGSRKDPRFIVLEHMPQSGKRKNPLVLIGKGITFDTGGISLKPAPGMHHMKGDMAGAAAVLGAFEVIGRLPDSFPHPVVGLLPCAENMPGGSAARPGDIVTAMSGTTVEILNTDAEGRLILCDALTYGQKNWTPLALVDIATLTGACAVALGKGAAGLFSNNDLLRDALLESGEAGDEELWPLPLREQLREGLKSPVADIANVGPREGGAISAALFLKHFVEGTVPWAHIDMAGAGFAETETPLCPKGGTGFGVRVLAGLARNVSEKMFK